MLSSGSPALRRLLALSLAIPLAACSSGRSDAETGPRSAGLITAAQIEASGARTAWEAVVYTVPYVVTDEDRNGNPVNMMRRGRSSPTLSDLPVVLVDNVRLPDFRVLDLMPAGEIESIQLLNGIDGTTFYGTDAGSGVIKIVTRR